MMRASCATRYARCLRRLILRATAAIFAIAVDADAAHATMPRATAELPAALPLRRCCLPPGADLLKLIDIDVTLIFR